MERTKAPPRLAVSQLAGKVRGFTVASWPTCQRRSIPQNACSFFHESGGCNRTWSACDGGCLRPHAHDAAYCQSTRKGCSWPAGAERGPGSPAEGQRSM